MKIAAFALAAALVVHAAEARVSISEKQAIDAAIKECSAYALDVGQHDPSRWSAHRSGHTWIATLKPIPPVQGEGWWVTDMTVVVDAHTGHSQPCQISTRNKVR